MPEAGTTGIVSAKDFERSPAGLQRRWSIEIATAKDAQQRWIQQATDADKRYRGELDNNEAGVQNRLNLFRATVNIILAVLYGQMPKVDVSRRFADSDDDEARVSSEILERHLNTDIEDDADDFEHEVKDALQDWKITGLGIVRLRYEAEFEKVPGEPAKLGPNGEELAPEVPESEQKASEDTRTEYVHWKDFLWSPCRRWKDVTWVAFKAEMTRDQAVARFGEKIGKALPMASRNFRDNDRDTDALKEAWSRATVWEIWDKDTKSVHWFCEGFDQILDTKPDPMGLRGFFPCPRPLLANATTSKLMPKPDIEIDKPLYDEIDELSDRLRKLVKRAQLKGAYNKAFPELGRIVDEASEGQLVPVAGWNALAEKGGLGSQMDFLPLDVIIKAIEVLSAKLVEKIQLLDQIVGISSAMRGEAQPHSTATANRIEAGMASTRLETAKDEVARFATDVQKLRAEIIAKHYDEATIIRRSNALRMEMVAPGQPNIPLIQAAVALLKSEFGQYRIEIKPDSLALRDYAALKQERVETISALAGLFQQAIPMVQIAPQAAPFILELGKWLVSATKGSQQMEGAFDRFAAQAEQAATAPKPPAPPDPKLLAAQIKAKAEGLKAQAGIQQTQIDGQVHIAKAAMDLKSAQAKHAMDMQKLGAQAQAAAMRPYPLGNAEGK